MLADKNESIAEAAETVYKLSEAEMVRLQCEAREDYYRRQRDAQILREKAEREKQALKATNERLTAENQKQAAQINQLMAELEKLRADHQLSN